MTGQWSHFLQIRLKCCNLMDIAVIEAYDSLKVLRYLIEHKE